MYTIPSAFRHRVESSYNTIALSYLGQDLTYGEIDRHSNQLARLLVEMGVCPGELVGGFLNRTPEMVISLLAILKAGGAYVPLDPNYPRDRTALLIDEAKASAIVTTSPSRQNLPESSAIVLDIDAMRDTIAKQSGETFSCPATKSDLAYVIFTSGSTGKPKGVMIEHRNVMSFFAAMDPILGTNPGIWLAVTSICFDISVLELLWTLTRGFRIILHGDEGVQTIPSELDRYDVSHFQATPSLARMLTVDPTSLASLGRLKMLLLGGEALPVSLASKLRSVLAGEMYNVYGPTETTIWSTAFRIPRDMTFDRSVPIGAPLSNTSAVVLDSDLQPLANGEVGELFLGGEGVARGYWRNEELTQERFLVKPTVHGGRMYRTGDLARWLPTGELVFLGRTDFQVKLRGHRIELAEIETLLEQQSIVRSAVVSAVDFSREGHPEDVRLVAYVVPCTDEDVSIGELRRLVASQLPDYMVPAHFVMLADLPLTANGKIDRKALPIPNEAIPSASTSSEVPTEGVRAVIAQAWAEALGVERVGIDDNLMDVGANSLMFADVHIELQRRLQREISLIDLFEFHTVSALAQHLEGKEINDESTSDRAQRRRTARRRGHSTE